MFMTHSREFNQFKQLFGTLWLKQ